ncbi:ExeM/NucH family extracellular endonuclease [Arenimonas sp. MALMAid1274]|uniref:ExeM/NucH family extracellular endonuclease n=1 Tax=Arenimonas sp. MALMAid1274 TaxID=3411630 RepID=UPI003B9E9C5D
MRPTLLLAASLLTTACAARPDRAAADAAPSLTAIGTLQGRADRSPLEGQEVTVEGIVTGNFVAGLGGWFLQSAQDDGDPATSEGLFVASTDSADAALSSGQRVRVTGVVTELDQGGSRLTALQSARTTVLGTAPVPQARLPQAPGDWERWEGMAVAIEAPLTVTGNDGLARFGELSVSFGGRLFAPTERAAPGPAAQAIAADNARLALRLDDGQSAQNPARIAYLPAPWNDAAPLRTGSVVQGVVGVVDERYGSHRLQLTQPLAGITQAARPPAPTVPGNRRIAGFNVLNLFNGDGAGGGFPTERGAASAEAYARQQAKLVAVVTALDPDLAALMELENDGYGPRSSIAQFVAALNAAGPHRDWRFVDSGEGPGSNPIRVGIVYRSSRFQTVGKAVTVADGPFLDRSRAPLVQAFRAGRGPVFVVAANHFKSKGGCGEATGGDADARDGQACYNATRLESARRLHDFLATDPTGTRPAGHLVIGDLNAHAQEDPLRLLRERGWRDAFEGAQAPYSYVWAGLSARLDHALLDAGLAARLRGAVEWHNNADESERFDYRAPANGPAHAYRASDHDPMLLGLDLAD